MRERGESKVADRGRDAFGSLETVYMGDLFSGPSHSRTPSDLHSLAPCLLSVLALENSISNIITTGSAGPIECCCLGRAKADHHGGDLVRASRHPTYYPTPYLLLPGSASTACSLFRLGKCHSAQFALQSGIVLPTGSGYARMRRSVINRTKWSIYSWALLPDYGSGIMVPTRHLDEQTCEV